MLYVQFLNRLYDITYLVWGSLHLITCSKIEHIPYNIIFTTKLNDSSILITIISWDYLNLSLANEYVGDITIPTYIIRYNQCCSRQISQSDCSIHIKLKYYLILKDQKILELMMTKGEQERALNRDKFVADLTWEHQRKLEEESKVQSEMKRRRLLAEENRIKMLKKVRIVTIKFICQSFVNFP